MGKQYYVHMKTHYFYDMIILFLNGNHVKINLAAVTRTYF